jgi:hypothetical protein
MPKKTKLMRIRTRGPAHGRCNICGDQGPLTEDHTPPKACRAITAGEISSLHDKLSAAGEKWNAPRHTQSGVTYKSLCRRCNVDLLGVKYDPALTDMCNQVRAVASSLLTLPATIAIDIAPGAVLRSVVGHMAAQGVERYQKGALTESIRAYILDDVLPLPASLRMYYWFYPFRRQVLVRDAALIHLGRSEPFAFWLMKFFPLAFFLTIDESPAPTYTMHNFDLDRDALPDQRRRAYLQLRPLIHPLLPESPDDGTALLYGEQAITAEPR